MFHVEADLQVRLSCFWMSLTPYHAKFYSYELMRRCPPDSDDRLAGALVDARVDLNPHQVEAALFAFRSPLSRGVLLADEVGLGLQLVMEWMSMHREELLANWGAGTSGRTAGSYRAVGVGE